MSFVCVDRTGELGLLADRLREDHDLLKQEHGHLLQLQVGRRGRVVGAEQRTAQQQLALRHNLALQQSGLLYEK